MNGEDVIKEYEPGHQLTLNQVQLAIGHVAAAGERGITTEEVGQAIWPGHPSATSWACSPLNRLRNTGRVFLLTEKRGGQRIYVIRSMVKGREIAPLVKRPGHCNPCTCDN